MSLLEQSRIDSSSGKTTQQHIRPFAPDDFRRERKPINVPPTNTSKAPHRAPPVAQSPQLDINIHDNDVFYSRSTSLEDQRHQPSQGGTKTAKTRSVTSSPDICTALSQTTPNSPGIGGSAQEQQHVPLKSWQFEAEKEWQSRQRRSSLGLSPSLSQSSLAKYAILPKSESAQSPISPFDHQLNSSNEQPGRRQSETVPNTPGTTRSRWSPTPPNPSHMPSPQSALNLAKERDANAMHRAMETQAQREKAGINVSPRGNGSSNSSDALQRVKSIMSTSSSKMSKGGDPDSSIDTFSRHSMEDHATMRATRRGPTTDRPKSMFLSQQTTYQPLEMSNSLSNDEKMTQLKRSQKLANMLGGEWWRDGEQNLTERETSSSPLRGVSTKRATLLRRQSDPLHLQHIIQARKNDLEHKMSDPDHSYEDEEGKDKGRGRGITHRWRPLHAKRSRSSLNLKHDPLSSGFTSTSIPLSPPPLDIHPKAAALLGLCVGPKQHPSDPSLFRLKMEDRSELEESLKEMDDKRFSSSSVEMLRDSDSIVAEEELESKKRADKVVDQIQDEIQGSAIVNREERRRRVKKISRWLGAVVPPHLIRPNPEEHLSQQNAASGYNIDDAPPSPMTDYMSGSPIFGTEKHANSPELLANMTGSASKPLIKAKAVVNAKLGKKNISEGNDRGIHFSSPIQQESMQSRDEKSPSMISDVEKMANVKRNHKLMAVFGEAPPQDLVTPAIVSPGHHQDAIKDSSSNRISHRTSASLTSEPTRERQRDLHIQPRNRNFRSVSPTSVVPSPSQTCFAYETCQMSRVEPEEESIDCQSDHRPSNQYRISIDSLEYLLSKDPPLLNDLVSALEEDDEYSSPRRYERGSGATTPVATLSKDLRLVGAAEEAATTTTSSGDDETGSVSSRCAKAQIKRNTTDSLFSDGSSSLIEEEEESREREMKVRRHQKLGRWFGEAPPFDSARGAGDVEGQQRRRSSSHQDALPSPETSLASPKTSFAPASRMAPRSAGSASRPHSLHHRALGTILNTIEGELADDEEVSRIEKLQLQERLYHLRHNHHGPTAQDLD